MSLDSLVPPGSTQIPTVLEKCLQYIEDHGQFAFANVFQILICKGQKEHLITCFIVFLHTFAHIFYSAVGLYVQGIYRKSPGASSKRAVKATLEEGTKSYACGSAIYKHSYSSTCILWSSSVSIYNCVFITPIGQRAVYNIL